MFTRLIRKLPNIRLANEWRGQLHRSIQWALKSQYTGQNTKSQSQTLRTISNESSDKKQFRNDHSILVAAGLLSMFSSKDDDSEYDDLTPPKKYIVRMKKSYPFLEFEEKQYKPPTPEDNLITTLKHSIVAMQFEKYEKAEQLLHLALRMAQDLRDADSITYCFDIMANLALEMEQYQKAEKLFVLVMQRLMQQGCAEDDIKMLHISAKIARIAAAQQATEKADMGFAWTLDSINKNRKVNPDDRDLYELMGLTQDWYGKHLMNVHRYAEARSHLAEALNIYVELHGKDDPEVIDLLNNLAAACLQVNDVEAAEAYIDEALKYAEKYPDLLNTGIYQANKGLICIKKGLIKEAKRQCNEALRTSTKYEIREGQAHAKYCLEQIALATTIKA